MKNRISGAESASRRDLTALVGIGVSAAAVVGGFAIEKGHLPDLISMNAAMIVAGGTLGAVLTGTPAATLGSAFRRCRNLFRRQIDTSHATAERILRYAALVRRAGPAAIELEAETMESGFLRQALLLIVDGVPPPEIRRQLEAEIARQEDSAEADARVFELAAGYAPTVGIIGAVVGLVLVMKQLGNVDEVGRGIASAFISTLYGVGLANLLLLPLAARIRAGALAETHMRELILEGASAVAEGLSLHVVRSRLDGCLGKTEALLRPRLLPTPSTAKATGGRP